MRGIFFRTESWSRSSAEKSAGSMGKVVPPAGASLHARFQARLADAGEVAKQAGNNLRPRFPPALQDPRRYMNLRCPNEDLTRIGGPRARRSAPCSRYATGACARRIATPCTTFWKAYFESRHKHWIELTSPACPPGVYSIDQGVADPIAKLGIAQKQANVSYLGQRPFSRTLAIVRHPPKRASTTADVVNDFGLPLREIESLRKKGIV